MSLKKISKKGEWMVDNIKKAARAFTEWIKVKGAREHNLKSVNVEIPKNALTVITGPSGSGKSSLALDVLYTEGKRRYMESLSSYARQFLGIVRKPEFDSIEGLCPAIAIEQKTVGANPRSTVGTITEIYDYLRVLFARIGQAHCPECGMAVKAESAENICSRLIANFSGSVVTIAAPVVIARKGEYINDLLSWFGQGYYRFIIDGVTYRFTSEQEIKKIGLSKQHKHTIDLLLDALEISVSELARVQEAIETSFKLASNSVKIIVGDQQYTYSSDRICLGCAQSIPELEPRFFSFNSPIGACQKCHGLGVLPEWPWQEDSSSTWKEQYPEFWNRYAQEKVCPECHGTRLNKYARSVKVGDKNIYQLCQVSIKELISFFEKLQLDAVSAEIAQGLLREIVNRLTFLHDVGLAYLSLNRSARTLSGGEGQRIRLATQIGSALSGVLYVLDEPSIGLHQRDNDRLIGTLKKLRDQGNTVLVVEHDTDTMQQADYLIDMGPGAGVNGGTITAVGAPAQVAANPHSLTGSYLSGRKAIEIPEKYRVPAGYLELKHARKNNLKDLTVKFPLGVLCAVSGVSGSGKSTLVMQELVPALERALLARVNRSRSSLEDPDLAGADSIEHLVVIDQTPIGRTPRSNPATYLGIFDEIRKLFASLPESNARGYKVGRFSFNVAEGRCFDCSGEGSITVTMHFMPEVTMVCKTCNGQRYNQATLQIRYKGKNIAQVLDMTAFEAAQFFAAYTPIAKRLDLLCKVGLDYIKLGQPAPTLSGGEAQRIKLVEELAKRGSNTIYIFDEPTTGLHQDDIKKLLTVLARLVDKGNSMIVIEHNLDVLKCADYIIDLGPEGGDQGGTIVASGTPDKVARVLASHTGRYLKTVLQGS